MSTNWAAVEVARFCRETGRTISKTIHVETFDFANGSKDREEFAIWAETNKEWQHLRKEFGNYGTKPGTEDKIQEGRLGEPEFEYDNLPEDRWASHDAVLCEAAFGFGIEDLDKELGIEGKQEWSASPEVPPSMYRQAFASRFEKFLESHEELSPRVIVEGKSCQSDYLAGYGFSPQYGSLDVLVLIGQEEVKNPRVVIAGVLYGPYDELHPDDVVIQSAERLRLETKLVDRTGEFKTKGAFDRVYIREGADEVKSRELAELLIANL